MESRSELSFFEPYQGGLSIEQLKRQYGLKEVIKLASNENPLGSSPVAVKAYKKVARALFRYPESKSTDLRQMLAGIFKVDIAQIIVGSGSDEVITLLAKAYLTPEDEIVVSMASFLQYKAAGHLMGAKVVEVPMNQLKHDLKGVAEACTEKTKMVFIANPNNPTGTYNNRQEVEDFLSQLPDHVLPVFDEAYFEYAVVEEDYPSMLDDFFLRRPMVVLRTFSKIYGLAGLRVGYGIGPEWCIQALEKVRPPFNVSTPAQAAALAALQDKDHLQMSVELNKEERKNLHKALTNMGFDVKESNTNFLLICVRPLTGQVLFNRLLSKGIITRAVDEYGLTDYLRVTVGKPAENKKFLNALQEVNKQK
ncbi:histidinol-phosphate transaminase [bacterium F11]|nr:histidinol-phosphate transaminase [bacterium F11]